MSDILNVVTALSRIENLPHLIATIKDSFKILEVRWHCYFDPIKIEPELTVDCHKSGYTINADTAGNPQKNKGLEDTEEGWIYFLDDDNAIHPEFEGALLQAIAEHPVAKGFVFNQLSSENKVLRKADRLNYCYGLIDLGQFVLKRSIIGTSRFPINNPCSDWEVFHESAMPIIDEIIPIDKNVTYYNFLRPVSHLEDDQTSSGS